MPVTRSSSILSSKVATQPPKNNNNDSNPDIIILSDDNHNSKPKRLSVNKRPPDKRRRKVQAKKLILGDVLEISSDDESPRSPVKPSGRSSAISNLQNQIQALRTENAKLQQDFRLFKETHQIDISTLEDHISCDICSLRLWSPYVLPECGHTFCEGCLQDWFGKILNEHLRINPLYNVNVNTVARNVLNRVYLTGHKPEYTCPSCRTEVKSSPVEEFTLKAVVRAIATAIGESSPVKERAGHSWDRFFGRITAMPPSH